MLLQVPRAGYRPALACQDCRTPAACPHCYGPLRQPGRGAEPGLRVVRPRAAPTGRAPHCGSARLRAPVVGEERTAEELGRAFPGVPVRRSAGDRVLADVPAEPALVVATPGAEPQVPGGYAAAVLLDTGLLLARPDLRTGEECLRRWLAVAALVRPAADGGRLLVVGDASPAPVQALVRADPEGFAARELAERVAARLPPAVRLATVEGPPDGGRRGGRAAVLAGAGRGAGPGAAGARPRAAGGPGAAGAGERARAGARGGAGRPAAPASSSRSGCSSIPPSLG